MGGICDNDGWEGTVIMMDGRELMMIDGRELMMMGGNGDDR